MRGTNLSIVPDPSITGTFIGELKNVTVRQALDLILPPLGLDYRVDGAFVRVFAREPETRIFDVNYVATERTATSTVGGDDGRTQRRHGLELDEGRRLRGPRQRRPDAAVRARARSTSIARRACCR